MSMTRRFMMQSALGALAAAPLALRSSALAQGAAESGKLVAFLVIDSLDDKIGAAVDADGKNMANMLTKGFADQPNGRLDIRLIKGKDAFDGNVLAEINKLNNVENDTVLFYFSGHGAYLDLVGRPTGQVLVLQGPPNSTGPSLLYRDNVLARLKAKKPRLLALVTDCCNNVITNRPSPRDIYDAPVRWKTLQALLLAPRGVVDLTSSARGEVSVTNNEKQGSLFTYNMDFMFRCDPAKPTPNAITLADKDGNVTWNQAFSFLKKEVGEDYRQRREFILKNPDKFPREVVQRYQEQPSQTVVGSHS